MTHKQELRNQMIHLRNTIPEEEQLLLSARIHKNLLQLSCIRSAGSLLSYSAFRGEASLDMLNDWVWERERRLALPKVVKKTNEIQVVPILRSDELIPGAYGIMEPAKNLSPISSTEVDIVLVPGVAFDRKGGRLGYGGGYYDRFLQSVRTDTAKIGICFHFQMMDTVPAEPHDIQLDAVVTDKELHILRPEAIFQTYSGC